MPLLFVVFRRVSWEQAETSAAGEMDQAWKIVQASHTNSTSWPSKEEKVASVKISGRPQEGAKDDRSSFQEITEERSHPFNIFLQILCTNVSDRILAMVGWICPLSLLQNQGRCFGIQLAKQLLQQQVQQTCQLKWFILAETTSNRNKFNTASRNGMLAPYGNCISTPFPSPQW